MNNPSTQEIEKLAEEKESKQRKNKMEKVIRRNRHPHASQTRIEELKKLVKSDNYVNSSINALADRMSKSVKIDMYKKRPICLGVNCDTCVDRKECDKNIVGRKVDFYA